MAMNDRERLHQQWLGYAEPIEGLVFSLSVLSDLGTPWESTNAGTHKAFQEFIDQGDEPAALPSAYSLLTEVLGFDDADLCVRPQDINAPAFESALEDRGQHDAFDAALKLYVSEAKEELVPTFAIKSDSERLRLEIPEAEQTPESAAGAPYEVLVVEVPHDIELDKPDPREGLWNYPPTHKVDRLLRATRVPVGLLSNGRELRLLYAPHGQSSGHLTFRMSDLGDAGGRPLLNALMNVLSKECITYKYETRHGRTPNSRHPLSSRVTSISTSTIMAVKETRSTINSVRTTTTFTNPFFFRRPSSGGNSLWMARRRGLQPAR